MSSDSSLPPPSFAEAVRKFEEAASSTPEVSKEEFRTLDGMGRKHKLKPKDFLTENALKHYAFAYATFGRTRPVLQDLAESSWALDTQAVFKFFGLHSLISHEFLRKMREFATLEPAISWEEAKAALDEASNSRRKNPGRGIPKRFWAPKDVTQAMESHIKQRARRLRPYLMQFANVRFLQDNAQTASLAPTTVPAAPSSAENVQDSLADDQNRHDRVNHALVDVDANGDNSHDDGPNGVQIGFVAGNGDSGDDSDSQTDSSTYSVNAPDVEMPRRDDSTLPDPPMLETNLDPADFSAQDLPHTTLPRAGSLLLPSLRTRLPRARSSEPDATGSPLKRRRAQSPEPDAIDSFKYRRISQDSKNTGLNLRLFADPDSFQPMSPLVENPSFNFFLRTSAPVRQKMGGQMENLRTAPFDGHVSVRRSRRSSPPAETMKRVAPEVPASQEPQNAEPTIFSGGSTRVDDNRTVDAQWRPSNAAGILQQLGPCRWLEHKAIWTVVELFLPPSQVRLLDIPEPSDLPWDLWATSTRLGRKDSDSMLLVPNHATTQGLEVAAKAIVKALGFSWDGGGWTYHDNPHLLQQTNGYDCGLHVIVSCIYLIARVDIPTDIDGSCWRVALSYALDPQPKSLFTPPLEVKMPSFALQKGFSDEGFAGSIQKLRDRSQILSKAAKHAEQIAHVFQEVYTRLCSSNSGLNEARQDVSVREKVMREWTHLPRVHKFDTRILQDIQETLTHAKTQLQKIEAIDKRLRANTKVFERVSLWLQGQRVELRELRNDAAQDDAKMKEVIKHGCKIYNDLYQLFSSLQERFV
ncbi:hypothetical protein BKA81DRAFT_437288 [Phyllosticta paracitricarpa]